jgi:hypothetical protein
MAADDAAVVVTLRANLKDYEAALKSAVRATERAASAAEKAVSGIGSKARFTNLNQNTKEASASLGAMQANAKNLGFQFNDLATSIASGGGALRAFAQQGGQISQIFSGMGLKQIGATIGTALLDPFVLIPIAIGVATTALTVFFSSTSDGADKTAQALRKVADEAEKLAKVLPDSAFGQEYARNTKDAADSAEAFNAKLKLQEEALAGVAGQFKDFMPDIANAINLFVQAGDTEGANKLTAAYNELGAAVKSGVGIVQAVADVLAALDSRTIQASDSSKELTDSMKGMQPAAVQAQKNLDDVGAAFEKFKKAQADQKDMWSSLIKELSTYGQLLGTIPGKLIDVGLAMPGLNAEAVTATPSASKTFLKSKAASDKVRDRIDQMDDDFATALAQLFTTLPSSAKIESGLRTKAEQAEIRARHERMPGGVKAHPAAPAGASRHEVGAAVDITGIDAATLQAAVDQNKQLETLARIKDPMHVQMAGGMKKAADDAASAAEREAEARQKATQNLADYLAKLDEQASLEQRITDIKTSGMSDDDKARAIAVETELQTALNTAKQNGLTLSEKEIAQIRTATLAKTDATLAGNAYIKSQQDSAEATKQFAQQIGQMAESAIGGLVNDLRNGVSAGDAFNNMLNRIIDSLFQMSIQSLFNPAGGGGGFLGKLFGIGHGGGQVSHLAGGGQRKVSPLAFANAPRYAAGGMVGLKPGEVPIIAHRGEIIVPNARRLASSSGGGRVDNSVHQQNRISIDMAGSGYVAANSENAKQVGENIQKIIQAELVAQSRPGGLLRQVPR